MKRIIRLTESELTRIVRRVILEQNDEQVQSIVSGIINNLTQLREVGAEPNPNEAKTILGKITAPVKDGLSRLAQVLQSTNNNSSITDLLDTEMQKRKNMTVDQWLRGSIAGPKAIDTLLSGYYGRVEDKKWRGSTMASANESTTRAYR